jgi:cytochrome oxidase Cu insertion factor (SCO1/SenC/PrrC family)
MEEHTNGRRNFLIGVSSLAGLLLAKSASAGMETIGAKPKNPPSARSKNLLDRGILQGKTQIPEVMVETHEGHTLHLYADLIKDKVVTMNYMSIENETNFPISKTLMEVARLLGPRLGTEVHMISMTSDPHNDTPERLRAFAEKIGAPSGWHFVRATDQDSAMVSARLYRHGRSPDPRTQLDLVHYGNAAVGLWAAFPATIQPDDAALRIMSVMNGKPSKGPLKQAGPRILGEPGPGFNNRVANI